MATRTTPKSNQNSPLRVVILGGGFGGLNAAKKLANRKGVHVTLIDRRNHHLFQPLLYQVAMAALSPADIAAPIRSLFSGARNVDVVLGNITAVDFEGRRVRGDFGERPYDRLVLACGSNHSYFGHDDWEEQAPGLKSVEEATEIRRRMLMAFEAAEIESDPEKQKSLLTFVVVGGGPTGVELAGALGEISRYTLGRDFRNIDPRRCRILLIEGNDRLLAQFHPELSARAARRLEALGVTIWTRSLVTGIKRGSVRVGDETIKTQSILWAAGVEPADLTRSLDVPRDRMGRIEVQADLSIAKHPDVFVVGDQACFVQDGETLPMLAPVAMQQGRLAAANIINDLGERPREEFRYKDKGIMATIGRAEAVVQVGRLRFGGFFGWLTWLLVHIYYLIGFRNRVAVVLQWGWSYLTLRRGARLITSRHWRTEKRVRLPDRYRELMMMPKKKS